MGRPFLPCLWDSNLILSRRKLEDILVNLVAVFEWEVFEKGFGSCGGLRRLQGEGVGRRLLFSSCRCSVVRSQEMDIEIVQQNIFPLAVSLDGPLGIS
jgi:hypothetical protein